MFDTKVGKDWTESAASTFGMAPVTSALCTFAVQEKPPGRNFAVAQLRPIETAQQVVYLDDRFG